MKSHYRRCTKAQNQITRRCNTALKLHRQRCGCSIFLKGLRDRTWQKDSILVMFRCLRTLVLTLQWCYRFKLTTCIPPCEMPSSATVGQVVFLRVLWFSSTLIRAFSDFKAFLYILIGGFSVAKAANQNI